MISSKYKKIYEEFIKKYEEIHVNPWHEISKLKLNDIYAKLTNEMDINDEYSFKYFMDYIIKRLSGADDAHTFYTNVTLIPFNFKIIDNSVLVNYPDDLKGYELVSINDIPINKIIDELDDVITYGTEGKRKYELEKCLFNKLVMFGIPSLRGSNELVYNLRDKNGKILQKKISKDEKYEKMFDYDKYLFGNNAEYKVIENCLIYNHSSVQRMFKEKIKESIKKLERENLNNVDTIIIDLRGNFGGNAALNKYLINYLKLQSNKKLICLTDYRVFSGGRYALKDLISLGAITIGEEIGTPINCYGNNVGFVIDNHFLNVSSWYLNPCMNVGVDSKEKYNKEVTDKITKPIVFKPDILVKQTKDDYINGIDTVLNHAIQYSKRKNIKHQL